MDPMLLQNFLETPTNMGAFAAGSFRIAAGGDSTLLNQLKEVNMHDKILINEQDNEDSRIQKGNGEEENGEGENYNENKENGNGGSERIMNYYTHSDGNLNSTPKFQAKYNEGFNLNENNDNSNNKNENTNFNNFNFSNNNKNKCINNFNFNFNNSKNNENNENGDSQKDFGFSQQHSAERPGNYETISTKPKDSSSKRVSLDLDVVNQSDTKQIFSETVNNFKSENQTNNFASYANKQIKTFAAQPEDEAITDYKESLLEDFKNSNCILQKDISKINLFNNVHNNCNNSNNHNNYHNHKWAAPQQDGKKAIFSTVHDSPFSRPNVNNLFDAAVGKFPINLISEADLNKLRNLDEAHDLNINNTNYNFYNNNNCNNNVSGTTPRNIKMEILNKYNKIIPMISPSRASLNISPKSAFVFNKKLFN